MTRRKIHSAFPVLQSERLVLREPRLSDMDAYANILSDPAVTKYSHIADPPNRKRSDRMVSWMSKLYAKGTGCAWLIEDRHSGELLGAIRLVDIQKRTKWAIVGYELHPQFWTQGIMSEALDAVADCAFDRFGLNRLEAWTLPGNDASDRVLEKCGFVYEGTLRQKNWFKGDFHDHRIFGLLKSEHRQQP